MTRLKKIAYSLLLAVIPSASVRTRFIKKHGLFGSVGKNCMIMNYKLPLYSNLVYLHDNVRVASHVGFVTHDGISRMLNRKFGGDKYVEKVGCIEIMNNVFIGSGTRILYNTRIGNNVIIGSASLVNKDIPDNSVYAGVPARYICSFDEYVEKHRKYSENFREKFGRKVVYGMDDKLASMLYEDFLKERDNEHTDL